jgi:hypothetical protein
VITPLLMNEKLVKEDSSGDDDVAQYRSLVGSLLYLTTRLNIIYASGLCINRTRYILELHKECCGICQV